MPTILIGEYGDSFVIHFGVDGQRINAYTLASTLAHIADAAKAANAAINPGFEIEVLVEALGGGSFKAKVRTEYRSSNNLFSRQALQAIVLSVIANFVYDHTLAPDVPVQVRVSTSEVIIEQGDTRIVVPRQVHDATRTLESNTSFLKGIVGAVEAIEADPTVRSFGFSRSLEDDGPPIEVPRHRFPMIQAAIEDIPAETREIVETTDVEILRAILEPSKRRWEFVWGGVRIPAPVLDKRFYDQFIAHDITIAPGDKLRVRLKIKQRRLAEAGVYVNQSYEVVEVLGHIPKPRQRPLDLDR
jgi:hypothetical protein